MALPLLERVNPEGYSAHMNGVSGFDRPGAHGYGNYSGCAHSSADESNADFPERAIKSYGSTSGGNAC